MELILRVLAESWNLLCESAPYVLFGLLAAGLLKVFLPPQAVARHLGQGRFLPVIKAALLGVPLPLCSCGVLPAAAELKRQGANQGATTAFLIATPESGVDSLAVSWALLDPILTVARPLAAFITATLTGLAQGLLGGEPGPAPSPGPAPACAPACGCGHAQPEAPAPASLASRLRLGLGQALGELWQDMAGWFFLGILLAGAISALVPESWMASHLGGGLNSMLWMLLAGVPLYICATSSTPIAAALILKGVSPGAALVFLLSGPATNATSLTVLLGILGRRGTALYLAGICLCSLALGLAVDGLYRFWGISPQAVVGQAAELLPAWLQVAGASLLLLISIAPAWRALRARWRGPAAASGCPGTDCGCPKGH